MSVNSRRYGIGIAYWIAAIAFIVFSAQLSAAVVVELSIRGAIGPATADYLSRGIEKGQTADLILINMDTPGGLYKSTRTIVQAILRSKTPVIVYVAPSGARAASAGTYLLYASNIAAMAPGTHLGAATPVDLIGGGSDSTDEKKTTAGSKKVTNDAIAYIRTLAQLRQRNPHFGEKAVREAATLTAMEALKQNVINFIADDRTDLLQQLNGLTLKLTNQQRTIHSQPAQIQVLTPDWRTRVLQIITDPTMAYLLLLLGMYGIFFEFINPGFIAPGVIGAIAMMMALYALQLLPVNYAGLGLIVLGVLFLIAEGYAPSFGALGLGGTVAFILGSILLIDTEHASYRIAWSAIWAMAAANALVFAVLLSMSIQSRRKPIQHGLTTIIGATGRTLEAIDPVGQAVIRGEIWRVQADARIEADKTIKIIDVDGLTLKAMEVGGL